MLRILALDENTQPRKRTEPFVNLTRDQMVDRILRQVTKVRAGMNDPFSVGVDATCLVSAFQIYSTHAAIVGGASPHHFIPIEDSSSPDQVKKILT